MVVIIWLLFQENALSIITDHLIWQPTVGVFSCVPPLPSPPPPLPFPSQDDAVKEYSQLVEQLVAPFEGKSPEAATSGGPVPSAQSSENLVITNEGGVYTIRFNRPNRKNAILPEVSIGSINIVHTDTTSRYNFKVSLIVQNIVYEMFSDSLHALCDM